MSKWFWNNDKNWVEYDATTSKKLEDGFKGGLKEIKVDDERFVQIVDTAELKKNFLKISAKELPLCIGMQRRYDDEMKRRLVKREVAADKSLFEGKKFYICTGRKKTMISSKDGKELEIVVKGFGGECTKKLADDVDYVVVKAGDTTSVQEAKAAQLSGYIVNENFIPSCIKHDKLLSHKKFSKVDAPLTSDDENDESGNSSSDNDNNNNNNNDDAEADANDEEPISKPSATPPPAKVAKIDTAAAAAATTTSSATAASGALCVEKGGKFAGSCIYTQTTEIFPFFLDVTSANGSNFEGVVTWKSLNDAQTKCRGSIDSKGTFSFEEYAIIKGEDDVVVPSRYDGVTAGTVVTGTVTSSSETATFTLTYIPPPAPSHPLDMLRGGTSFNGTFRLEVPYTIAIKPGESDIAIVTCTTAVGNFATEARVEKKDNGFVVSEFAEVPGNIPKNVPRTYTLTPGKDEDTLSGTIFVPNFITGASTQYGTAELSLSQKK